MDTLKIAVIGDEDTIAGFLLAGVGDTSEAKTNFLTVDKKTKRQQIEVRLNYEDLYSVCLNFSAASVTCGGGQWPLLCLSS